MNINYVLYLSKNFSKNYEKLVFTVSSNLKHKFLQNINMSTN